MNGSGTGEARGGSGVSGPRRTFRDRPPRILVLTLYSGEGEYPLCVESVRGQRLGTADHVVFEHLPVRQAHERLYATVMEESARFDLFVKLDADMVLAGEDALERLAAPFDEDPTLDHLVCGVADWFTGTDMIGVHVFSHRARWAANPESLYFLDPDPVVPGSKLVIEHPDPPVVHHSPDPTPLQAFHFGAKRGYKACQPGRRLRAVDPYSARLQWRVVERLWERFRETRDPRLGLAVLAAERVLDKTVPPEVNDYSAPAVREAFRSARALDRDQLLARLSAGWRPRHRRWGRWMRAMGPAMSLRVAVRWLRDLSVAPLRPVRRRVNRRVRYRRS